MTPDEVAGVLKSEDRPPASVTLAGEWSCPDDHEWEDVLTAMFGPDAELLGPSVLPRGLRALYTAQAKTPGCVAEAADSKPLPPHVVS